MQVLFVHQAFPAQFGHIAKRLQREAGWSCFHVSQSPPGVVDGVEKIEYKLTGGATGATHFCSRTFENTVWHCDAVFDAMRNRPDIKPDLIVGHSGFGSTLFLRELYPHVPVVNLFEYYYHPHDTDGDMDFRRDLGWKLDPHMYLRSRCRNAMILLDLQNCQLGYCPTNFQRSRFPKEYQPKLRTVFEGIDRDIYHGQNEALRPAPAQRRMRTIAGVEVGPDTRIVTYVSRGMESMRGFDKFMQAAKLIARRIPDVKFLVVGGDQMAYGGDLAHLGEHRTFKDWTLAQDEYDLSKFHFAGWLAPADLATLLASTDLHIYLTVPFVLSWSMMNAMSCGAVVLGSNTSPVREMVQDGVNGLLADFFNPADIAEKAARILQDPAAARPLGRAAEEMIKQRYSVEATMPATLKLYQDAMRQPVPLAEPQPAEVRPGDALSVPGQPAQPNRPAPAIGDSYAQEPLTPQERAAAQMTDAAVMSKIRAPNRSPFRG